ncbi:MAG: 23S rRNA (adenine(2503)-C(2))-methyltransferase RlmN [Candidatus Peribacteraceae bacterium]|nr:23S rRNA (adenine(2503)-C(2))-methyltransferase RlmN [Candidatus Peribacteraceae bacterium]MDD5074659.1 23S rRNA (adenine(2503)-C(2))-methyltransferase RlmN [Candidatus Peribacteraceae bacterium]
MHPPTREYRFRHLFPDAPAYRLKQMEEVLFKPNFSGWKDVTVFPKEMREKMEEGIPWISVELSRMFESRRGDTFKAILETEDGLKFETVLMGNATEQWTVCVSSQVGCAMRCVFCATGAMGLKRSLTADEITDQIRFWRAFLSERGGEAGRISNVVFMGMGEPLANVENVKRAINVWLKNTDLGPTHITVSTVGVLKVMEQILTDREWPPVRIAVSLHSADQEERAKIVPSTEPGFLEKLADWCHKYAQELGNRHHHLTFEYTLIQGVNDSVEQAEKLARFLEKAGKPKLNVIPLNVVTGKTMMKSSQERIDRFKAVILKHGIDVTQRRTMGDDIAAACGQLATQAAGCEQRS